jgi:thiol-disulfide isomerase/thioredoxin
MNKMIALLCSLLSLLASAQQQTEKQRILYGTCTPDSLVMEPFGKWFNPGYENYHPSPETATALKKQSFNNISIKVFFGTWCGDSKREVPHFLKLLSAISFPGKQVQLIGLGGSDSLIKQSPGHEENGLGIFRVPTFIIYKNGVEINRINEYPVYSLEKDLLTILTNQPYSPNYRSFSTVFRWLKDGTLQDENNSTRGMAEQLRFLVANEYELNNLGYLLLKQGKKKEALKVFRMNYTLYPQSSSIASSLGEGYYENGDYKNAISFLEYSLELNKDPKAVKEILSVLDKAKEKERN